MENTESTGRIKKPSEIQATWETPEVWAEGGEMEMTDEMRAVFRAVEDALAAHRDITEMRDVSTALANAAVMARMIAGFEEQASLSEQLESLKAFRDEIAMLLGATAIALVEEGLQTNADDGKAGIGD